MARLQASLGDKQERVATADVAAAGAGAMWLRCYGVTSSRTKQQYWP